jgi:hypothetical protein
VLPAFVTGRKEPAPRPAEPARHRPEGALPPSERGMLVFVAALLGIGTIAVVIMLGMGGLNPRHGTPAPSTRPSSSTPSPAAAAAPLPTQPVPTDSPASSAPAPPPPTKRTMTTPARTFVGNPNPYAYCLMVNAGIAQRPDHDDPSWSCQGRHRSVDFTPDQVCDWQYGTASFAVVSSLPDPSTWKCYK